GATPAGPVGPDVSGTDPAEGESSRSAPATPLPLESTTFTTIDLARAAPAVPRCASPLTTVIAAAAPASAAARSVTGAIALAPCPLPTCARSRCVPVFGPRVQRACD